MSRFFRVIAVAVMLFGLGLAGVSAQDDPPSALTELGLPELKITVTGDGFEAPAETEAGLTLITLDNQSTLSAQVQLLELPDDMTLEEVTASFLAGEELIPDWIYSNVFAGGVMAAPGTSAHAVVDLTSGDWVVYQDQSMDPTVALKVTGDADRAESGDVESDVKVTFEDHKIDFPDELEAGPQVWEITNKDDVPHVVVGFYYPGEITAEELMSIFSESDETDAAEPTVDFTKLESGPAIAIHSKDQISWIEADLKPGTYVMLCFSSDQGSETAHAEMGMTAVFTVPGDIPTS
jgi:hypothetical protein